MAGNSGATVALSIEKSSSLEEFAPDKSTTWGLTSLITDLVVDVAPDEEESASSASMYVYECEFDDSLLALGSTKRVDVEDEFELGGDVYSGSPDLPFRYRFEKGGKYYVGIYTGASEQGFLINARDYAFPKIDSVSVNRCNPDGSLNPSGINVLIEASWSASPVGGLNKATVTFATAEKAGNEAMEITWRKGLNLASFPIPTKIDAIAMSSIKDVVTNQEYALDTTKVVYASIEDSITSNDKVAELSIGFATMDFLKGGKGVSIGAPAIAEGFECAMDARFDKTLHVDAQEASNPSTSYIGSSDAPYESIYGKYVYATERAYSHGGAIFGRDVLFDNANGATDVTLSASAADYRYLDIYFSDPGKTFYDFSRVYSPNGKAISLSLVTNHATNKCAYLRASVFNVNGNKITLDSNRSGMTTPRNTGAIGYETTSNIYISHVDGWK